VIYAAGEESLFYLEFVLLYYFDEFHASYSFPPDKLRDVEWHDETEVFYLTTLSAANIKQGRCYMK